MQRLSLPLSILGLVVAWNDSAFFDWFADELEEVAGASLVFEGQVPFYLSGTFVQTGPGRFGFGQMRFTHMMDGYSKTNTIHFLKGGRATYTTQFLASAFFNDSNKSGKIERGVFVGNIEPPPDWGPTAVLGHKDNNYIKMRALGDQRMILSDTMIATNVQGDCVSFNYNIRSELMKLMVPGVNWKDSLEPLGDMCMLGTMAHAAEDEETGTLTGSMGCFGVQGNYHMVFNLEPSAPTTRKLLAKISLPKGRGPSYMHTLAATPNCIVLVAEPLHMNMEKVLAGEPLGRGGLDTTNDVTLFQIVNRKTGSVRTLEAPGFIYGHMLNSWEEKGDILMDLTWYPAGNMTTLGWFNRWFLEYMKDVTVREHWPRSQVVRYRLTADGKVEKTELFEEEKGENDFETPKINEQLSGRPYCIVYMMQFHSYAYHEDQQAIKGGPLGAVGVAKRNLCTGERMGWYMPNMYPSEVQFVANPGGTAEDDGVLLSMVFDGNTNSSFFQILDAHNMKQVAKAPLPIKTPFLIHSSYFSAKMPVTEVIV